MSAPTALAETGAPPRAPDFSDWLSPILVKELRQGLKSRVFVGSFIVMQVVMIMTMGMRLLEQASGDGTTGSGFDTFFWAMFWLPLLLLMPARGLSAVSEEARANTFDLVQLTRMTAFRIALGKWVALIAQTLLLTASLLPYAMVRYYFGGVDVMNDLAGIAYMLMLSLVLTAAAVALSSASLAMRVLVLAFVVPTMLMALGGFAVAALSRSSASGMVFNSVFSGPGWWPLPLSTAIWVTMFLEFAAARFAPLSENHASRKRVAGLLMALLLPAASFAGGSNMLLPAMTNLMPLIAWVSIDALTQSSHPLPSIYAPFARRGFLARGMGRVLYPGWATAVPFLALVLGLTALAFAWLPHPVTSAGTKPLEPFKLWCAIFFALISPLPLMMFLPRFRQRFWLYLLLQLFFGLVFAATNIVATSGPDWNPVPFRWLAPFPTAALMAMTVLTGREDVLNPLVESTTICGVVILVILAPIMWREFRMITQRERIVLDPEPKPGAPA